MPKDHFTKRPHHNLVRSIREAGGRAEIASLLELGHTTFDNASEKTRSRWHEAAKARLKEIGHSADTVE